MPLLPIEANKVPLSTCPPPPPTPTSHSVDACDDEEAQYYAEDDLLDIDIATIDEACFFAETPFTIAKASALSRKTLQAAKASAEPYPPSKPVSRFKGQTKAMPAGNPLLEALKRQKERAESEASNTRAPQKPIKKRKKKKVSPTNHTDHPTSTAITSFCLNSTALLFGGGKEASAVVHSDAVSPASNAETEGKLARTCLLLRSARESQQYAMMIDTYLLLRTVLAYRVLPFYIRPPQKGSKEKVQLQPMITNLLLPLSKSAPL